MPSVFYEDYDRDPTLAAFHEPRKSVRYDMTLTDNGEVKFVRVEREAVHEDAPLQIEDKTHDDQR